MIVGGVDTASAPQLFGACKTGKTLILDGDGPCYVASATAKRLDTAIRRFQSSVLASLFMAKAQDVRIHLTAHDSLKNYRFNCLGVKPYQGNRTGKSKPALLEPLRQAIAQRENWLDEFVFVRMHYELEADDGMIMDAYELGDNGITQSEDKDLRVTPYPYMDIQRNVVCKGEPFGWLTPKTTAGGTVKLIGQGPLFFWAQMLMGDTADNVRGLMTWQGKLCGAATAYEALQHAKTIHQAANIVIDGYRAINQNPLPEAWCLWLLRWPGDNVWEYFKEMELTDDNRRFVDECVTRDWFRQ